MKKTKLLVKPFFNEQNIYQPQVLSNSNNIFTSQPLKLPPLCHNPEAQSNLSEQYKMYEYVGSSEIREKVHESDRIKRNSRYSETSGAEDSNVNEGKEHKQNQVMKGQQQKRRNHNKSVSFVNSIKGGLQDSSIRGMGSRNNKTTMSNASSLRKSQALSKLNSSNLRELAKEKRNISYYQEYVEKWRKEGEIIQKKSGKKHQSETLFQNAQKYLKIEPNQQKKNVLENYINFYWEMSLRNNSVILKRHLKGNKYETKELEKLLQSEDGRKQVEESIPQLPIDKLKSIKNRKQFTLVGHNKQKDIENVHYNNSSMANNVNERDNSMTNFLPSINEGRFSSMSQKKAVNLKKQEIFKVDYDRKLQWMNEEGLTD